MGRRLTAVFGLALLASLSLAFGTSRTRAQDPSGEGVVRGRVTMATAGATIESVEVEFVILEGSTAAGSLKVPANNGAYEIRLPAVASRTYVPHVRYQAVDYFADPVRFTGTEREFTRDFTVHATTDRAASLRILQTFVTVVGIDPLEGRIGLLREDVLGLGGDRVYTGVGGVTLRIPAPPGTVEASEEDGNATFADGVLSVTTPVRPGNGTTIVITTYTVKYDPSVDRYRLRVTAPLATESIITRVPRDYVRNVRPVVPAVKGEDEVLEDKDRTVLSVVRSPGRIDGGQALQVDIDGVAGVLQRHPLTEQPGASIAAAGVLFLVSVAGVIVWRRRETGG